MNEYEAKQLEKAERYEERSKRVERGAQMTLDGVRAERQMIPLGQPILVGHHSEKRHRNHLKRMDNRERRGWEEHNKATHYAEKAERIKKNLETNAVISSDDPDAVEKLKAKLVKLEEERTKFKEYNKKARAVGKEQAPGFYLRNLAGNVRSVKERIKRLESKAMLQDSEKEINGVRIVQDTDDNRIRLFFPGKPAADVRSMLKSNGFRWSPNAGAWQRMLNGTGIWAAERVVEKLGEESTP